MQEIIQETLIDACEKGDYDKVKCLLETENIDVNIQNGNGNSPLHLACVSGKIKIVELLLNYKINGNYVTNTNLQDKYKYTALHYVYYDHIKIVKLLLDHKINGRYVTDPFIQDNYNMDKLKLIQLES